MHASINLNRIETKIAIAIIEIAIIITKIIVNVLPLIIHTYLNVFWTFSFEVLNRD